MIKNRLPAKKSLGGGPGLAGLGIGVVPVPPVPALFTGGVAGWGATGAARMS